MWILLVLIPSLLSFWPVLMNGFVNRDDYGLLIANPHAHGLSWDNLKWAWTTTQGGEYRPLAWMLLQLQHSLWELSPVGYHTVSLFLHFSIAVAAVSVSRLILEKRAPGFSRTNPRTVLWASAFASGLLMGHPLRVEAVAWVSVQSHLWCALCLLLSLHCHLKERPRAGFALYLVALCFSAIALPLPILLVLLEPNENRKRALPLFAVGAVFACLGAWATQRSETLDSVTLGPWPRIAQGGFGIVFFTWKTFFPTGLRAIYSFPKTWADPMLAASVAAVTLLGILIARVRTSWPNLFATVAAYVSLLLPVFFLPRSGVTLISEHYGYLPLLAFLPSMAYGTALFLGSRSHPTKIVAPGLLAGCLLATLSVISWQQCLVWRSSETVWRNVINEGDGSAQARNYLASHLLDNGQLDEAQLELETALGVNPSNADAHDSMGILSLRRKNLDSAVSHFETATKLRPRNGLYVSHLGLAFLLKGDTARATGILKKAREMRPGDPDIEKWWLVAMSNPTVMRPSGSRSSSRIPASGKAEKSASRKP